MTKTQENWPDPKRPGVPLFADRDGWHALGLTISQVKWWDATNQYWWDSERRYYLTLDEVAFRVPEYRYDGPVLTTTQIKEMLAAERERCAKTCEAEQIPDFSMPEQWHNNGCKHSARAIRNLGDAP